MTSESESESEGQKGTKGRAANLSCELVLTTLLFCASHPFSLFLCSDNFWLLANQTDAEDQLNWFADVLGQALELGEKVVVMCHAPLDTWNPSVAAAYLSIATSFQSTILNIFMGHTHNNQIQTLHQLAQDGTQGTPMHTAWIAGSVTPYTKLNPGLTRHDTSERASNECAVALLVACSCAALSFLFLSASRVHYV